MFLTLSSLFTVFLYRFKFAFLLGLVFCNQDRKRRFKSPVTSRVIERYAVDHEAHRERFVVLEKVVLVSNVDPFDL